MRMYPTCLPATHAPPTDAAATTVSAASIGDRTHGRSAAHLKEYAIKTPPVGILM
jgi:hypothetical protein